MNGTFNWSDIRNQFVIYEDEAILAINKPAGIAVVGENNKQDLLTLARDKGEHVFPVHRIDKVTSGLVLFAKSLLIHGDVTREFNKQMVEKRYLAITKSIGLPKQGTIDLPLSVGRKNKVRIAAKKEAIQFDQNKQLWSVAESVAEKDILKQSNSYPSLTHFTTLWEDSERTLLAVMPVTGRRHQIRVHLAWIGYPIEGDPFFSKDQYERTYLHSWKLSICAPWKKDGRLNLEAKPTTDFWKSVPVPKEIIPTA